MPLNGNVWAAMKSNIAPSIVIVDRRTWPSWRRTEGRPRPWVPSRAPVAGHRL